MLDDILPEFKRHDRLDDEEALQKVLNHINMLYILVSILIRFLATAIFWPYSALLCVRVKMRHGDDQLLFLARLDSHSLEYMSQEGGLKISFTPPKRLI